jgi:hypothetical protein
MLLLSASVSFTAHVVEPPAPALLLLLVVVVLQVLVPLLGRGSAEEGGGESSRHNTLDFIRAACCSYVYRTQPLSVATFWEVQYINKLQSAKNP